MSWLTQRLELYGGQVHLCLPEKVGRAAKRDSLSTVGQADGAGCAGDFLHHDEMVQVAVKEASVEVLAAGPARSCRKRTLSRVLHRSRRP